MNVRVIVTVIGLGAAAWANAHAQATGIWLAGTHSYQGALSQTRLGGVSLFGGALGLASGSRTGLGGYVMVGATDVSPSSVDSIPGRAKRLELGAELRYRPQGNGDHRNAEYYFILGAGIARTARDTVAGVAPHGHAGVAVALPIRGPFGVEARTVVTADRANAVSQGFLPGPDAPSSRFKFSLRAGVSLYFRPTARERRIPPQYVPEIPAPGGDAVSYEQMLRAREPVDHAPARAVDPGPVAAPGGVISGPTYMQPLVVADTLETVPPPGSPTARRVKTPAVRTARDTIQVIADTLLPAPVVSTVPPPVLSASPQRSDAAPQATSVGHPPLSQSPATPAIVYVETSRGMVPMRLVPVEEGPTSGSQPRRVTPEMTPPAAAAASASEARPAATVPIDAAPVASVNAVPAATFGKTDELARSEDRDGSYLTVTPEQHTGTLGAGARARIARFAAANRTRAGFAVALIVSAATRDPKGTDHARASVADLRSALVEAGVLEATIYVREWSTPGDDTSVRVVFKSAAGSQW